MSDQSQQIEEHRQEAAAASDDFVIRCAQIILDLSIYGLLVSALGFCAYVIL